MDRRWYTYILIAILAVALFFVRRCSSCNKGTNRSTKTEVNRDRGFDRRTSNLEYSNHAKCRMECRKISREEVEETMRDGTINYRKSDLQAARCPRYALETTTKDNQRVRIIFAQCNDKTEVVTVIDLDTEWTCDCPGDDNKYQNNN